MKRMLLVASFALSSSLAFADKTPNPPPPPQPSEPKTPSCSIEAEDSGAFAVLLGLAGMFIVLQRRKNK